MSRCNCYIFRTTRHNRYIFLLLNICVLFYCQVWLFFALVRFWFTCFFWLWRLLWIFAFMRRVLWFIFFLVVLRKILFLVFKWAVFSIWNLSLFWIGGVIQRLWSFAHTLLAFLSTVFGWNLIFRDFSFFWDFMILRYKRLFEEINYNLMIYSITIFLTLYIFFATRQLKMPTYFNILQSEA